MAEKHLVVVENSMVDLFRLEPLGAEAYEVEKRPDGTLVFSPLRAPDQLAAARAAAAPSAELEEWDASDPYPPGVTIRPVYADEWRNMGLN